LNTYPFLPSLLLKKSKVQINKRSWFFCPANFLIFEKTKINSHFRPGL
jgi:hypothetical protein